MNAKNVKMWYVSLSLFVIAVIPFVAFMFRPNYKTLVASVTVCALAAVFHVFMTKRITHPQYGYTAVQAMKFYSQCKEAGVKNTSAFRDNKAKVTEIANTNDFSKNMGFAQLLEMFGIGKHIQNELKG